MADTVNFLQNGYSGEVLEDLLTYTVQGNDTVREGLIHIKTGIQHRYTLPAIKLGNIIQDNVPTPQPIHGAKGDDGTNEYQFTERHLEPSDFMVYLEFNPRDYEKYWRFSQPEGNPGDDAPSPYGQEKRVYRKRHLDFRPRRRDGGQDYRTGRLHENRSQQGEIF